MKKVYLSSADEDAQKVEDWISLLRSPDFDLDFYKGSLDAEGLSVAPYFWESSL